MKQKVNFHIHIDARENYEEVFKKLMTELNFFDQSFSGSPDGYASFQPNAHLTLKLQDREDLYSNWKKMIDILKKSDFTGYTEGEFIKSDEEIPYKEYVHKEMPFKIRRRKLSSDKGEKFRETELHLVMDREKSDQRLIKNLLEAGMYGAHADKTDQNAIVLTIQGFRPEINKLKPVLHKYLLDVGGAVNCSLKEELAIEYEAFDTKVEMMPEVAESIEFF